MSKMEELEKIVDKMTRGEKIYCVVIHYYEQTTYPMLSLITVLIKKKLKSKSRRMRQHKWHD